MGSHHSNRTVTKVSLKALECSSQLLQEEGYWKRYCQESQVGAGAGSVEGDGSLRGRHGKLVKWQNVLEAEGAMGFSEA